MMNNNVRVSIGLPVYNGERYLVSTIESLLAQSYRNFELIIVDNASTDTTGDICKKFAAVDSRIQYHRASTNRGAAWSFNKAFALASGEYFKWAADDDLHHPYFVERCVQVLNQRSDVVLCFARTAFIDQDGQFVREYEYPVDVLTCSQRDLFRMLVGAGHIVHEIFGLIRSESLRETPLIGGYVGADIVLLGKLALLGRFHQVPELLFEHREHDGRSALLMNKASQYTQWFDSSKSNQRVAPHFRMLAEHAKSVFNNRMPIREKMRFVFDICRVANWTKGLLWKEARDFFSSNRTRGQRPD